MRVGRLITLSRRWLLLPLSPTSPATYSALAVGTGSSRWNECPDQARCLASVGAAAASGAVLPFRLDYLVKVGMLRKLGGIRVGFEAIALSIVSLGMIDAIAMLPLSISATATSGSALRGPLLIVVVFGVGCCTMLVVGGRLSRPAAPVA